MPATAYAYTLHQMHLTILDMDEVPAGLPRQDREIG